MYQMGLEWAEYGIRVVGIAPGPIAGTVGGPTGRVFGKSVELAIPDKGGASTADSEQMAKDKIAKVVPLGRWGEISDIAHTALFVASPAGSFITMEQIVVDGGQWHGTSAGYRAGKKHIQKKRVDETSSEARAEREKARAKL
jgi:peroxisomal 2,4-dienoyl-CoA reductase